MNSANLARKGFLNPEKILPFITQNIKTHFYNIVSSNIYSEIGMCLLSLTLAALTL